MVEKKSRGLLDLVSIDEVKEFMLLNSDNKNNTKQVFDVVEEDSQLTISLYDIDDSENKTLVGSVKLYKNYLFSASAQINDEFTKFLIGKLGSGFIEKHLRAYRMELIDAKLLIEDELRKQYCTITQGETNEEVFKVIDITNKKILREMTIRDNDLYDIREKELYAIYQSLTQGQSVGV